MIQEDYTKLWEELERIDFSQAHLKIKILCEGNFTAYHASFIFDTTCIDFFISIQKVSTYSFEWCCRLKQIGEKYCDVVVPPVLADEIETITEMKREQERRARNSFVNDAVELLKELPHANDKTSN